MNDAVECQQERFGGTVAIEEAGIFVGEHWHGFPAKPDQHIGGVHVQRFGGGKHQFVRVFVGVAAQGGIRTVQSSLVQQQVPYSIAVHLADDFFQQVENHTFHCVIPE